MFAGKKSAQIREILISESAWEEMTCLFAPSLAPIPSLHTEVQQPFQGLSSSHIYDFLTFEIYPVTELMKFFSMPSYLYSMRRSVNDSINVNTFKDVSAAVFVYYWGPCK
ncbi:hypothetical protein RU51_24190 [Salmonella enterica subsp. enterica serovar Senftenberg]|nr:hypothetical protein [Salmonella enterica subsp. enterica serovar Senftenberg]EDT3773625.1 hypothetical protein [Salmonella enterica subsp. enterica serovar Gaminara]